VAPVNPVQALRSGYTWAPSRSVASHWGEGLGRDSTPAKVHDVGALTSWSSSGVQSR
jgi:hypothetical protein